MERFSFQLIPTLLTAITAIGAVVASVGAWKSAKQTKKSVLAQVLVGIMDDYSSPDMFDTMKNLRNYRNEHGKKFSKSFAEKEGSRDCSWAMIDEYRRKYSHHFHKMKSLLQIGLVDKTSVRKIVSEDAVRFLFEIVEPLEKASDANYDRSTFDMFHSMYPECKRIVPAVSRSGLLSNLRRRLLISQSIPFFFMGGFAIVAANKATQSIHIPPLNPSVTGLLNTALSCLTALLFAATAIAAIILAGALLAIASSRTPPSEFDKFRAKLLRFIETQGDWYYYISWVAVSMLGLLSIIVTMVQTKISSWLTTTYFALGYMLIIFIAWQMTRLFRQKR